MMLYRAIALALALIVAVLAPMFASNYLLYLCSVWCVTVIAALGLNLTLGYAGQISLAQATFMGIGAYATALLQKHGVPFFVDVPIAAVICFGVGWVFGYPALKVQHHYLAFVTLAFATLGFLVFRNEEWLTGGVYGLSGIQRPSLFGFRLASSLRFYYLCLAFLIVAALVQAWIIRSPWGRALMALRENPIRALSLGVDTRRYTLLAFAIGAAFGGMAGAIYTPLVQFIEPQPFNLDASLSLLLMVIVGGSGRLWGPFVGAAIAVLLPEWLRFAQSYYLLLYAFVVIVLMRFCPTGLVGLFERALAAVKRQDGPHEHAHPAGGRP